MPHCNLIHYIHGLLTNYSSTFSSPAHYILSHVMCRLHCIQMCEVTVSWRQRCPMCPGLMHKVGWRSDMLRHKNNVVRFRKKLVIFRFKRGVTSGVLTPKCWIISTLYIFPRNQDITSTSNNEGLWPNELGMRRAWLLFFVVIFVLHIMVSKIPNSL